MNLFLKKKSYFQTEDPVRTIFMKWLEGWTIGMRILKDVAMKAINIMPALLLQ